MTREPWYSRWFGKDYLEVYPHRDHEEAEEAVDLLVDRLETTPGTRVLDLACGAGRHLRVLQDRGLAAMGLDLSLPLLQEARREVPEATLLRGDMRSLPFRSASFGLVASFFTSFGYFDDETQDRRVLAEIGRVLTPDGAVFLDFLNADQVRRTLTPRDEARVGGRRVVQERVLREEGRLVEKTIRIDDEDGGPPRVFHERVRLYELSELEALLSALDLAVQDRFGDYDGSPFTSRTPRLILLARRGEWPSGPREEPPAGPEARAPTGSEPEGASGPEAEARTGVPPHTGSPSDPPPTR